MAKVAANGGSDPIEDATATEMELRVDVASQPGDKTASTCDIEALLEKVARALGKKRMLANAQELACTARGVCVGQRVYFVVVTAFCRRCGAS